MQLQLFNKSQFSQDYDMLLLEDLFKAYFDARKNKRNTINALKFEVNFEEHIFKLYDEIISGDYNPSRSICFIVNKPVKREIFAADFRDRIIHHWIYNHISPLYEKSFIHDSYSCRKGKGTHFGIQRMDHFMRSISQNFKEDAWILKLDIQGYFMAIKHDILFKKISAYLFKQKDNLSCNYSLLIDLIRKTINTDPAKNCTVKGKQSDWDGLPKTKSLFYTEPDCGLPIGNLTSQLFGNIYLNDFDHYVKNNLRIRYYGRYVDDFVLMHRDKEYLKHCISEIRSYLSENLKLTLHPKKIYLQHVSKGVKYLGAVIKPHRKYVANRTLGNFHDSIRQFNILIDSKIPDSINLSAFIKSMNSYLGIMGHYRSFKKRKKIIDTYLSPKWWTYVHLEPDYRKFSLKPEFKYRAPLSCSFKINNL